MSRSRGAEISAQYRQSPRSPLSRPRSTTTAESNGQHRSVKLEDGRYPPRSPLHEANKKQQGTRVANLEAKLGEALEELKKLREQLEAVESSKLDVQLELEQAMKRDIPQPEEEKAGVSVDIPQPEEEKAEPRPAPATGQDEASPTEESESSPVTDVFEVVIPTPPEGAAAGNEADAGEKEGNVEQENLKAENERLKKEMREKEDLADAKLSAMAEELRDSRALEERLEDQLEEAEGAKAALQEALKRLMVQSEQWRKAAEAAVTELEIDGRDSAERQGGRYERVWGRVGSPLVRRELEDELGGKRKGNGGGGSRMFGDLWKKQQHRET